MTSTQKVLGFLSLGEERCSKDWARTDKGLVRVESLAKMKTGTQFKVMFTLFYCDTSIVLYGDFIGSKTQHHYAEPHEGSQKVGAWWREEPPVWRSSEPAPPHYPPENGLPTAASPGPHRHHCQFLQFDF